MAVPDYLTTRELAELLRIKERKVYDLVASGAVPHNKATGKLLFERRAVLEWLAAHASGPGGEHVLRPAVALGSHDPMLDWALRQSGCGIAALFNGSMDGLDAFAEGRGIMAGLHVREAKSGEWNVPSVASRFGGAGVVLVEWTKRARGLIIRPELAGRVTSLTDIGGWRVVLRQKGTGSQALFEQLTGGQDAGRIGTVTAGTEVEAALAVLENKADIAFGLEPVAAQHRLGFVPVLEERFDLLFERRAWFEPAAQRFWEFCGSAEFAARAGEQAGYDFSDMGRVRFNSA